MRAPPPGNALSSILSPLQRYCALQGTEGVCSGRCSRGHCKLAPLCATYLLTLLHEDHLLHTVLTVVGDAGEVHTRRNLLSLAVLAVPNDAMEAR